MSVLNHRLSLIGILVLAGVLRLALLSDNPPGLFRDEADKGYATYALIETGKDSSGRSWPLQIKSFEAYTSPFYHWLSIPSIRLLGLDIFSTRLPAALAGTLACGAVYLLGAAWSSKKLGLMAALLLAISPWHLLFSRWANQGILMTLFIPLALWATWKCLKESADNRMTLLGWVGLSGILWGISWNTYAPARLFIPLFMASIFMIQIGFSETKGADSLRLFLSGLVSLIAAGPFVLDILMNWEETQTRLEFLTGGQSFSFGLFMKNYFAHWNPMYLILNGDANPRHHILGQGQLSWTEVVLWCFSIVGLIKTRGTWRGWLIAWFILAPIPAAITNEGLPHALRTLMIVPAFALSGGIGLAWFAYKMAKQFSRRTAAVILSLLILSQSVFTGYQFFRKYPNNDRVALAWEKGLVDAIEWVEETKIPGEVCVITGIVEYPDAYLDFVLKPDPRWISEGGGYEGYHLLPTGKPIDPRVLNSPGLYLERSMLGGKPSNWRKVQPTEDFLKMDLYWRLYRVIEK